MATLKHKHNHHNYDLYDDVEKIKSALLDATYDVKGRAAEIFADSITGVKTQTTQVKDNLADYTAKKPFKSLGIALAVGVALGMFIRR